MGDHAPHYYVTEYALSLAYVTSYMYSLIDLDTQNPDFGKENSQQIHWQLHNPVYGGDTLQPHPPLNYSWTRL